MNLAIKKKLRTSLYKKEVKLTQKDIDKIKRDATNHALKVVIGFSLFALKDEFGFGKKRLIKFYNKFFEINDAYNKSYIDMDDVWEVLEKEAGLSFSEPEQKDK